MGHCGGPPGAAARHPRAGAAEPLRRSGPAARGRHRRLGRGVAGHGRPREPRAGLAGARHPARGHRGGRPHPGAPPDRLPDLRPRPGALARPGAALPRAGRLRRRGAGPRRVVVLGGRGAPAPAARRGHVAPPRLRKRCRVRRCRGRGAGRRGARPGGGRGGDRDALQRPRPRGAPGGRGGRRPAPPHRRRRRDLRAQPQHQLHERLHVQVPLLRLLQGTALAQPARRALPAGARRDHPARGRGRRRGRHRGLPAGRHPPQLRRRLLPARARGGAGRLDRHPHPRLHRAGGDRGRAPVRGARWPST